MILSLGAAIREMAGREKLTVTQMYQDSETKAKGGDKNIIPN